MKIGYACIPVTVNYKTTRSFMLKNFNYDRFYEAAKGNLLDLLHILKSNIDKNIYFFRISSDIIPFASHEINDIEWWNIFKNELAEIGQFIKANSIRVSMHPGQYTVLNSPSEETVLRSIKELDYHAHFLDSLGIDYSHKLVLHVGGVYSDKFSAMERFIKNFYKLSQSTRNRLIVENDEKSYSIEEVLSICNELNIPAVFDNLHHKYNPSMEDNIEHILGEVKKTWKEKDGNMKLHYSDESPEKRAAAHSDYVITGNFLHYYNIVKPFDADIMLEVKDKDISAIKCINVTALKLNKSTIYDEWAKYKYLVMEKNYSLYKQCSSLVNSDSTIIDFYKFIDHCLALPYDEKNFKNTVMHIWGYFKDKASTKEQKDFFNLLDTYSDCYKVKEKLLKLCIKYEEKYLLDSYYFVH